MKFKTWFSADDTEEIIACFGGARLVKRLNGKYELIGGSHDDRIAAREWISLFFHVVVREVS
jgi:hypothetical protein